LLKVVLGKTAGTAAGASVGTSVGAFVGSVVPILGTAAGAVVGGVAGGIIAGVSVDKLLLELEELIGREAFKATILEAIQGARSEFKAQLRR
jgi:phage tail tape-measure protein